MKKFNILIWFNDLTAEKKVSAFEFIVILGLCWIIRYQSMDNKTSYTDGKASSTYYEQRMKQCDSEKIAIQNAAYALLFERRRVTDSIHNADQKEIQDLLKQRITIVNGQEKLFTKTLKK